MPKPAIGAVGLVSFEPGVDGCAVQQTLGKLRASYEVKRPHVEGVGRLIMNGVGAVNIG